MKIAVLVSGGVDSSVALALLKQQGHDVTAFYLKIWLEADSAFLSECPWEDDLRYVRAVCEQLEVPLEIVSLQKEYWEHVIAYTLAQVKAGRTPNPDVMCNNIAKFGFFLERLDPSFTKVATGHYAQLLARDGRVYLHESPDIVKDQTYFLCRLSAAQREKSMFPIGHLPKQEVRALAQAFHLPNRDRKDSQGLCFLGKLKFSEFLRHYVGEQPGPMIEYETSKRLGTHKGIWYHTIGQRQGSGLSGGPWYVVAKDSAQNIVYFSRTYYDPHQERRSFVVEEVLWATPEPVLGVPLGIKMRHGPHKHTGTLEALPDGRYTVMLEEHDQGIAPGQFAVFYQAGVLVGSGVIAESSVQQHKSNT